MGHLQDQVKNVAENHPAVTVEWKPQLEKGRVGVERRDQRRLLEKAGFRQSLEGWERWGQQAHEGVSFSSRCRSLRPIPREKSKDSKPRSGPNSLGHHIRSLIVCSHPPCKESSLASLPPPPTPSPLLHMQTLASCKLSPA